MLGLSWWIWLLLGVPALLLTVDLSMTFGGGRGLVRSRRAALLLLGLLVLGNFVALSILVAGLVTTSTKNLGGGELLLTAFAIWSTDVIVFALLYWELDSGGPAARIRLPDVPHPTSSSRKMKTHSSRRTAGVRRSGTTLIWHSRTRLRSAPLTSCLSHYVRRQRWDLSRRSRLSLCFSWRPAQ